MPNAPTRRSTSASRPSAMSACPVASSDRWHSAQRRRQLLGVDIDARRPANVGVGRRATPRPMRASRAAARAPRAAARDTARARPGTLAQLRRRRLERQLVAQRLDLARDTRSGGDPSRQQAGAPRDLGRDVRVAVAIAADPGAEPHRRRRRAAARAGVGAQRAIDAAQIPRQRVPQALLEHHQAAAHLVERRRPLGRAPRRSPTRPSISRRSAAISSSLLRAGEIGTVAARQRRGDPVVFLHERAPGDLGRMRREHELDLQRAHRLVQPSRRTRRGASSRANASSHEPRCGRGLRVALIRAPAADAVMLLGDVREVQEMRERPRDRQPHRRRDMRASSSASVAKSSPWPALRALRQRPDTLDRLEHRFALMRAAACRQAVPPAAARRRAAACADPLPSLKHRSPSPPATIWGWLSTNAPSSRRNRKPARDAISAPSAAGPSDYSIRWVRRTKKDRPPPGADDADRAKFAKLRDYLLRLDDEVACKTCGKKFEIPSQHSLMFVDQLAGLPNDDELEREIADAERPVTPSRRPSASPRCPRDSHAARVDGSRVRDHGVRGEESAEFTGLLTRRRGGTEVHGGSPWPAGLRPAGRIEQDLRIQVTAAIRVTCIRRSCSIRAARSAAPRATSGAPPVRQTPWDLRAFVSPC